MSFSKAIYEYIVIPKDREDIDVLETSLTPEMMNERYIINTRGAIEFLKYLYKVEYQWKRTVSPNGPIDRAYLTGAYEAVPVDIDNPEESLKKVDESVSYHRFEEPPLIDSDFLTNLSRTVGTGANLPKRFLATQLATVVEEDGKKVPLVINIVEAYLWMQENPAKLRGIAILPHYKLAVIVADPMTKEELKSEILGRLNASLATFRNDYMRAGIVASGEEEEE